MNPEKRRRREVEAEKYHFFIIIFYDGNKYIYIYLCYNQEFSELTGQELAIYLRQWPFLIYLVWYYSLSNKLMVLLFLGWL